MDKWEYKIKYITNYSQLDELGQKGWELCGIDVGEIYIFKRKIQQENGNKN